MHSVPKRLTAPYTAAFRTTIVVESRPLVPRPVILVSTVKLEVVDVPAGVLLVWLDSRKGYSKWRKILDNSRLGLYSLAVSMSPMLTGVMMECFERSLLAVEDAAPSDLIFNITVRDIRDGCCGFSERRAARRPVWFRTCRVFRMIVDRSPLVCQIGAATIRQALAVMVSLCHGFSSKEVDCRICKGEMCRLVNNRRDGSVGRCPI